MIASLAAVKPVVLLVDDDELLRFLYCDEFINSGMEVIEAGNGEEALVAISKKHPNIIVTDINMPIMNGFEFISRLREEPKWDLIPIIAISGNEDRETRERALKLNVTAFYSKPVEKKIMSDIIRMKLTL